MNPGKFDYIKTHCRAVVLESFGVGGIPESLLPSFYSEMERWSSKGKFVVMTTQVPNEGSNMTVYEVGKKGKRDFKLIESYDMTFEATITKLMWILGMNLTEYDMIRRVFYTSVNHDTLFANRMEIEI